MADLSNLQHWLSFSAQATYRGSRLVPLRHLRKENAASSAALIVETGSPAISSNLDVIRGGERRPAAGAMQ